MDLTYDGDERRREGQIEAVRELLNARCSRNSLLWHQVEATKGVRDWSRTDDIVEDLCASGIEPVFFVIGSPSWANGMSEDIPDHRFYVPTSDAAFQTWLNDYASFVREAASRYRNRVTKWELWSEQNQHYTWKPGPNPDQYVQFYRVIRAAILSANPQAEVSMGALSGLLYVAPEDMSGLSFMKAMHARGVYPDIVAMNPYPSVGQSPTQNVPWENNFGDVQIVYDYLKTVQGPTPVWITEWGWNLDVISEADQAAFIKESLEIIRDQYTYVSLATVFMGYDNYGFKYGLLDGNLKPRPAAHVFRSFVDSVYK